MNCLSRINRGVTAALAAAVIGLAVASVSTAASTTASPEAAMIFSFVTFDPNSAEILPRCMTMMRWAMLRHSPTSEVE